MRKFDIEYDDFSGGLWTGGRKNGQPKNTWEGADLIAEPSTGYLVPTGGWTAHTNTTYPDGVIADSFYGWASDLAGEQVTHFLWDVAGPGSVTDIPATGYNPAAGVLFDGRYCAPDFSQSKLIVAAPGDVSATIVNTPDNLFSLTVYESWLLGVAATATNRIHYCAPYDVTSWPAANYYDIGSVADIINFMCVHAGALYIATNSGWFVASGIPGETFSVRRMNEHGTPLNGAAVSADLRILYTAPARALLFELAGAVNAPACFASDTAGTPRRIGSIVATPSADGIYCYDILARNWFLMSPANSLASLLAMPGTEGRYALATYDGDLFHREMLPADTGYASSAYVESTAVLAEYAAKHPFIVQDVIAEVELDSNSSTATRSIKVQIATQGHPDLAIATASAAATSEQTATWAVAGTGQVAVVRLSPNDCLHTYLAQPRVKLKGVKLRRLILRCAEVD